MSVELNDDRFDQDDSEQEDGACSVLHLDYAEDVVKFNPQTSFEPNSIRTACSLCDTCQLSMFARLPSESHLCACICICVNVLVL